MRQGFGVRQSVPYGLAAVVNNEMRANSMTSLSTDKSLAHPDGKQTKVSHYSSFFLNYVSVLISIQSL